MNGRLGTTVQFLGTPIDRVVRTPVIFMARFWYGTIKKIVYVILELNEVAST